MALSAVSFLLYLFMRWRHTTHLNRIFSLHLQFSAHLLTRILTNFPEPADWIRTLQNKRNLKLIHQEDHDEIDTNSQGKKKIKYINKKTKLSG